MTVSEDKKVDVWIEHSNQMWRAIYATPIIAATIVAGWYATLTDSREILSNLLLLFGLIMMIIQFFVIRRMIQYADAFKAHLTQNLPPVPKAIFGVNGARAASIIPLIVGVIFIALIFVKI